ncbi:MAG: hemerythrin domain-containing protein [Actinomycetota bacterium]|nr:hemerythrin domain-containing protein [Actinomycetota bacterium]
MSTTDDYLKAKARPDDLLAAVLHDHAEIKQLFAAVERASGSERREEAFRELTRKLIVHETAEQEVVHPLTGNAPGGEAVVRDRLEEEKSDEQLLDRLEKMGVDDPGFDAALRSLRADVVAHAEHEEEHEHPILDREIDRDRLVTLARVFRAAESTAPTHPHPGSPTSPAGNAVVGPFAAIADRARDAIHAARSS